MGVAVQLEPSVDRFVKAPVRKMLIGGNLARYACVSADRTDGSGYGMRAMRPSLLAARSGDRIGVPPR